MESSNFLDSHINADQAVDILSGAFPPVATVPNNLAKSQHWLSQKPRPEYVHTDTNPGPEALPSPLLYGLPKWSDGYKIGLLESTFAPGHFAHLPVQDQIFITEDGRPVNINGTRVKYTDFLKDDFEQPKCVNCETVMEALNNWRRSVGQKEWMCNSCGELTFSP